MPERGSLSDRTKADAYERGMQEGLDLRDALREQLADRDQDLKILGKEIDCLRAENERLLRRVEALSGEVIRLRDGLEALLAPPTPLAVDEEVNDGR